MLHPREMNFRKFKLSEFSLVDNFTLIEPEAANVRLPKRFYDNARFNNYSQMEWDKLNDRYCLSPLYQIYRMILPIVRWLEAIRQSRLIKFRWLRNRIRDRFRERCL